LGNPATPPSLWNLFGEKESTKKTRLGLAGFEPTTSDRGKEKPIPDEGDRSSVRV